GLDGASLAWVLASRLPDLPVVMMSGLAPQAVRERLGGLAVAGVLAKPFGPQEVLERVAHALEAAPGVALP
ncbi:MAG TPA: hypothetical protein PKD53_23745, partial [Chloroflexaceae bacterium]|nr:hypothetical protein [Chloroflexaceae bacterium]